jgi:hypothetical protein
MLIGGRRHEKLMTAEALAAPTTAIKKDGREEAVNRHLPRVRLLWQPAAEFESPSEG